MACGVGGLLRRCLYTGLQGDQGPSQGWRQGDAFREETDSADEEVVYEERGGLRLKELRRAEVVHGVAAEVVEVEPRKYKQQAEQVTEVVEEASSNNEGGSIEEQVEETGEKFSMFDSDENSDSGCSSKRNS